ncbi:unnamed protein product [Lactuca saligna]|uniref:Uncharacterized protein n=1 Tax=Lactuca saligna TaxID=75948 RepID=A0AA35UWK2_LACSI|nr:unnamed protein product [Lactuca saligna]
MMMRMKRTNSFKKVKTTLPSTSSGANEVAGPLSHVIEGEIEEVNDNDIEREEDEEVDDNLDDSSEDDIEDENICDDNSDDEVIFLLTAQRGARGGGCSGSHISGRDAGDRNASQSYNDAESQPSSSVRGSNNLEQVPSNPSKRKFIEVDSEKEFTDQISVIRVITCILKTMFDGPWTSWKKVDKEHRDAMWEHFKGLYVWPEETDVLARKVWEDCMKKRFPNVMRRSREASLKLAKAANANASLEGDLNLLKDYRPNWIKKEYWEKVINEVWTTSKWKCLSQSGKNNRNKLEDGSVSKHTGGSISIRQHKKRMELNFMQGCTLNGLLKSTLHQRQLKLRRLMKVIWWLSLVMVLVDTPSWIMKHGVMFPEESRKEEYMDSDLCLIQRAFWKEHLVVYERVQNEMCGEMDAKAAEMEAKYQQMREEMDAKAAAIDAKQQQIDAKYEAMEKMYAALQNMMGN